MKTLMKKALSFIIAACILCVPVIASAEDTPVIDNEEYAEENYVVSDTYITVGTASYALSSSYDYTIFTFEPSEEGLYTFTVTDGLIAIVSYTAMWVTVEPSETTVTESTAEWKCTDVEQSIWLAVISELDVVEINATQEGAAVIEPERIIYANKTTPTAYTFEGVESELLRVETFDGIVDTAVLGEDGYYHLNSEDGYILLCDLSDTLMSLNAAYGYGQLKTVIYEDDVAVTVIDYNEAFAEYYENCDSATNLYPLTEDLIEIFKNVGRSQAWYGSDGWIGGNVDDAWMFACYYSDAVEDEVMVGDLTGDGTINGKDANVLKQIVSGALSISEEDIPVADMYKDGNINGMDANMLARYISGAVLDFE